MLRVITMTSYRRPAYTREVLAGLAKSKGISDWVLLPNTERGNAEVNPRMGRLRDAPGRERKTPQVEQNTHEPVFRAFKLRADVTVHLEDDTVSSPEALRYFDWASRELLIPLVAGSTRVGRLQVSPC